MQQPVAVDQLVLEHEPDVEEDQHVLLTCEPLLDGELEQVVGAVDAVAEQELGGDREQHGPVQGPGDEVVAGLLVGGGHRRSPPTVEGLDAEGPAAGFSRISGLDRRVAMIAYRAGNAKTRSSTLLPGLVTPPRVVLERGLIGSLALHEWLATAVSGRADRRTVIIDLLGASREQTVQRWRLLHALPTELRTSPLDAQRSEVVVESLTLVAEDLEVE